MILTYILLIAIAVVVMSFIYLITARITRTGYEQSRTKALYIAEAGINKAAWYIITPQGLGGHGNSWRTTGTTETFADGNYTISVADGTGGNIIITSTGECNNVYRTVQQQISSSTLPAAFQYAVYNNGGFTLSGNSTIKGDIFSKGNMTVSGNSNHPTGETYLASGYTLKVNNKTTSPDAYLSSYPAMPTINTTYYDQQITSAKGVASGNQTITNYNLNGGNLFVNGNLTINGNVTGGGVIAASGTITVSGNSSVASNTQIISNKALTISGNTNFQSGDVLYSATSMSDSGNNRLNGSIMAPSISINGNDTIYGFLYSWGVSVAINGNVNLYGAVVNPASSSYSGNITIQFDDSYLPSAPPGLSGGGVSLVRGSWKEL